MSRSGLTLDVPLAGHILGKVSRWRDKCPAL